MGELLRREVIQNPDDELWQRIDKKMNTGEAVPMVRFARITFISL